MRISVILLIATFSVPLASASQPGKLLLLDSCPGDIVVKPNQQKLESLWAAALTPIVTGIVKTSVGKVGASLKESAKEKTVDNLHVGDYFYKWKNTDSTATETISIVPNIGCIILASKQTKKTKKTTVSKVLDAYQAQEVEVDDSGKKRLSGAADNTNTEKGKSELIKKLGELGFSGTDTPSLFVVFDVQYSEQNTEFRLVPRYVYLDHSTREAKVDRYLRDFSLSLGLSVPGNDKYKPSSTLKFERVAIGTPWLQDTSKRVGNYSSYWLPMPSIGDSIVQTIAAFKENRSKISVNKKALVLAGSAALALGVNDEKIPHPDTGNDIRFVEDNNECPLREENELRYKVAHSNKEKESVKPSVSASKVSMWTNTLTYLDSCTKHSAAKKNIKNTKESLENQQGVGTFDLSIEIKEFRKRPIAAFFGEVFSDSDVISGVTQAVVSGIDPATKAAAKEAALTTYENARLKAEEAIIAHESAAANEKAAKLLAMEYAKRAANRAADGASISQPYPESGSWFD